MKFFLLEMKGLDPLSADPDWDSQGMRSWCCPVCMEPLPRSTPLDVVIQGPPTNTTLNIIFGPGIQVAKRDFLEAHGLAVEKDLFVGKVTDDTGKTHPNFASVIGRETILLRGGHGSKTRVCKNCGRRLYEPWRPFYIMRNSISSGRAIYETHMHNLVINEELHERIRDGKWPKLKILNCPVLDEPRDGLPAKLSMYETPRSKPKG